MTMLRSSSRFLLLVLAAMLVAAAWAGDQPDADNGAVSAPEVRVKSQVPPYYPATASLTDADAVVVLAARIGENGKVGGLEVVDCDRPGMGFEEAATDAVKHWKFNPAQKDGEPVAAETFVTLYIGPPSRGGYSGAASSRAFITPGLPQFKIPLPGGSNPGGQSPAASLREGIMAAERPGCTPGERCIYDRSQLNRHNRLVPLPGPVNNKSRISRTAGSR